MDKVEKFRILINLALIDNRLDISERDFLIRLGALENLSEAEIDKLIAEEQSSKDSKSQTHLNLNYEEKVDVLSDLIRVMKADGKVIETEVKFCESTARTFGFEEKSVGFLAGNINMDKNNSADPGKIYYRMRKYLIQNS